MSIINKDSSKLDYYIKSYHYLWVTDMINSAIFNIVLIMLVYLFCITYLFYAGVRDARLYLLILCLAYVLPLVILPNILISSIINSKRELAKINKLANNQIEVISWKNEFMSCSSVKLIDLVVAKRFDILESEGYQIKKDLYISQFKNWLNRTKYITKHQMDKLNSENRHQYDVDKSSFIALANLRNELDIDDHEFAIIL